MTSGMARRRRAPPSRQARFVLGRFFCRSLLLFRRRTFVPLATPLLFGSYISLAPCALLALLALLSLAATLAGSLVLRRCSARPAVSFTVDVGAAQGRTPGPR